MGTVTTVEAAKHLGITRQAVHKRIRRGTIRAARVGRDWLIARSELQRQLRKEKT